MTHQQAIRLALTCIRAEIRRLGPDANLHEVYGADYASAKQASARRNALRAAASVLEGPQQEGRKL